MSEAGSGTKVEFVTDLTITGAAAQYGRGMIQDISSKLTNEFAECLKTNIAADVAAHGASPAPEGAAVAVAQPEPEAAQLEPDAAAPAAATQPASTPAATPPPPTPASRPPTTAPAPAARSAKPVGGIRLGLWALWQAVVRFFRRLFGGRKD